MMSSRFLAMLALGRPGLAIGILLTLVPSATATQSDPAGVFRYQLRALGAVGGEAVLTVGSEQRLGGKIARRIRIEARTAGIAGRVYKAKGDGTAIVDAGFRPVRVKWESNARGYPRAANVAIDATGVRGTYRRQKTVRENLDFDTDAWAIDAISAYVWIPQQPLTPGRTTRGPFFDGRRMGTIESRIGEPQSIQVPLGYRDVIPVHILAGRPGREREVVFWVGRVDRVLYRVEVSFGILGTVQADLVGFRRPAEIGRP